MHTYITHTTLLALLLQHVSALKGSSSGCTTDKFPTKKMRTRCKIQFTEQRVLCSKHSVTSLATNYFATY